MVPLHHLPCLPLACRASRSTSPCPHCGASTPTAALEVAPSSWRTWRPRMRRWQLWSRWGERMHSLVGCGNRCRAPVCLRAQVAGHSCLHPGPGSVPASSDCRQRLPADCNCRKTCHPADHIMLLQALTPRSGGPATSCQQGIYLPTNEYHAAATHTQPTQWWTGQSCMLTCCACACLRSAAAA